MAKITITQDDINRSKVVDPGWYNVEVMSVTDSQAKSDGSLNTTVELKIIDGTFKGAIVYRLYNEKAPGLAIPFLKALGASINEDGGTFDLALAVGKRVKAFIKNEDYQGITRNRVEDFQPISS